MSDAANAVSKRACVQYLFVAPSAISSVSNVSLLPKAIVAPLIVILLFVNELLGILAKAIIPVAESYVTPLADVALISPRTLALVTLANVIAPVPLS